MEFILPESGRAALERFRGIVREGQGITDIRLTDRNGYRWDPANLIPDSIRLVREIDLRAACPLRPWEEQFLVDGSRIGNALAQREE